MQNEINIPNRSDAVAFAKYAAGVMLAFAEGKKVESTKKGDSDWIFNSNPAWFWSCVDYRIAPEAPKVEPFTFENAPGTMKVRRKSDGKPGIAELYPDGYSVFYALTGGDTEDVSFTKFAEDYEQLDGTPCGTVKEKEWPKWYRTTTGEDIWKVNEDGSGTFYYRGLVERENEAGSYSTTTNWPRKIFPQIPESEALALIEQAKSKAKANK